MNKGENNNNIGNTTPTHHKVLFPNTQNATPNNTQQKPEPKNADWINNAVKNRSEVAQKSILNARALSDAKRVDPRGPAPQSKAKNPVEHRAPSARLSKLPIEKPNPVAPKKNSVFREFLGLIGFILIVAMGSWFIYNFIIRSFDVTGPSMYPTLDGNVNGRYDKAIAGDGSDRLIINRLAVTINQIRGKTYIPQRGQVIVFENPNHIEGAADKYIVKRVIALPGERVTIDNGVLLVHNSENPTGFNPYESGGLFDSVKNPGNDVAGDGTNVLVGKDEIFVVGDHRDDEGSQWSMDSRTGNGRASMGNIPLNKIVGPVSIRIWPLNKIELF